MPIPESEILHKTTEKGTIGGDTYWIEHSDWVGEERALCFRLVSRNSMEKGDLPPDSKCAREAGWGTWHIGEGACKTHGGSDKMTHASSIKNGKGAVASRNQLRRRIDDYISSGDRDSMLDLTYELAALRVLFQELVEHFPDPTDKSYTIQVSRAVTMIQATGSLVDKISRIQSRNNITAAQVMYLRAVVADILAKYLTDPDYRERAVKELMARVEGGETDQETRMVVL